MSASMNIIRGTNTKPASSQALVDFFSNHPDYRGYLLIGYPIIGTSEGRHPIDALMVSPNKGIIIFDLVEGVDPSDFSLRQDDAANKLEARLKTHRELMQRRDLLIPINTISFAPGISDTTRYEETSYPLVNMASLQEALVEINWSDNANIYEVALSAIQAISTIRKSKTKRNVLKEGSRGAKLKLLEDSIATLDNLQSKAVLETVDGVQRIRGLAGSGKTIVLALKAAYLHAQHPDWRIAVTFNTRSLKGQFKRLINNFSLEQTGEEPDWDNLRIINAWGAPGGIGRDGIYHEFCRAHEIDYYDLRAAKRSFGRGNEFNGACEHALEQMKEKKKLYDAVLVDEAQDFPPTFLRLCYELLDEHKRLVYAYDELQNLSGESLPPPEEIFGRNFNGSPRVKFEAHGPGEARRDIILEKCYRNSRPVLVTAHALGFGVYREPIRANAIGLVQMFDHPQLWKEIGYSLRSGELREGSEVVLSRTDDSSPKFLEEHSPIEDLVQFISFEDEESQAEWLTKSILQNLDEDELRHDDIIVINPDPISTREKVGPIRRRLLDLGVSSHLAGVDTDPDIFFQSEMPSVTFTGIYRAKGNEAGMVYIINAQDCQAAAWNLASIRNRLFTAITRSKAWVRVLGIGTGMERLIQEFEQLKAHRFELHFSYPTKQQREQLMIVHRDMSSEERKHLVEREKGLQDLISDFESGKVHPEDIDEAVLTKLKDLLLKRG